MTALAMRNTIFCDTTPCSPVLVTKISEDVVPLFQDRTERSKKTSKQSTLCACLAYSSTLKKKRVHSAVTWKNFYHINVIIEDTTTSIIAYDL
jgi:hypothetical protein